MYVLLCDFVGSVIPFFLLLYVCSRFCAKRFSFWIAVLWTVLWWLLQDMVSVPFGGILLGVCGLCAYGMIPCKMVWQHAVLLSVFLVAVLHWVEGMTRTLGYWIAKEMGSQNAWILQILDMVQAVFGCVLLCLFLWTVTKWFCRYMHALCTEVLAILICPFLFVLLCEQVIATSIYGDTVVWSDTAGLVYPLVEPIPIFFLQVLAGMTFFSVLFLFGRLQKNQAVQAEHKLLMHQMATQTVYMQEMAQREQQFCALRHDMKNHFLLLQTLLKEQKTAEAIRYLSDLEVVAQQTSASVQTGNPTVDSLLKNKCAMMEQKGIDVHCAVRIPPKSAVKDMQWCILFANAIDNATQAMEHIPKQERYLHISGKQKGDFLYLCIENACEPSLSSIVEGIGVQNMRTVVQTHGGTLAYHVQNGRFVLDMVLLISQQ